MGELVIDQSTSAPNTFVGRERELAELRHALDEARAGRGRLFLISGEPGIGKTRLAEEVAREATARGMRAVWGRCWEGAGAPAYWPWIQIIRECIGSEDSLDRCALSENREVIETVEQIVPELRPPNTVVPQPAISSGMDAESARFKLFDSVATLLKGSARLRALAIVIDDIHDADEASLAMLHFVARESKGAPILIFATYREGEVARSPNLSATIGELARNARAIPLRGLSAIEVKQFVQTAAGHPPADPLVTRLHDATNGNPLFLDGIVRILVSENRIDSAESVSGRIQIPVGVTQAINRQLAVLSTETMALLRIAAAIGKEFGFELCRSVTDVSADDAKSALKEASLAGIVTALDNDQYRFAHALIRDEVYDSLDSSALVDVHGKIASRIEELNKNDLNPHLDKLAHHFREANLPTKAIEYSICAGQAALEVGANADSVSHWELALSLMEAVKSEPLSRADLMKRLGDAEYAIDLPKSVRYRQSAIELYESVGAVHQAARLCVLLGRVFSFAGLSISDSARATDQFRRAESLLAGSPDKTELGYLYEGIAACAQQSSELERCREATERGMEIATHLGDRRLWSALAGFAANVLALAGELKRAFALFDRAFKAADETNSVRSGMVVANLAGSSCIWLGDPREARGWWERELNRPRNAKNLWARNFFSQSIAGTWIEEGQLTDHCLDAKSDAPAGRFWSSGDRAEIGERASLADACERAGDRVSHFLNRLCAASYAFYIGDYADAETHLKRVLDNGDRGRNVIYEMRARPQLAAAYAWMNRLDAANEQIMQCHEIMSRGEDWRGRVGDLDCAEGVIAGARRNYDLAFRQFESARAIHRRYHLLSSESETLRQWGRVLAASGDRTAAAEKFDESIELNCARGCGPRLIEWVKADKLRELGTAPIRVDLGAIDRAHSESWVEAARNGSTPAPKGREPEAVSPLEGTFKREGDFWTVAYQGATFRLKEIKGLTYLAFLLAHPGERFHARDLAAIVEGATIGKNLDTSLGDTELRVTGDLDGVAPGLDPRARADYRRRLNELKDEVDEAERFNDIGRAARAREELDFLNAELASAAGIGGRARKSGSHAERARMMVGKNIRKVLDKIGSESPALGRYLSVTIRTGYYCSYQPDPDRPVSWQLSAD